MVVSQGRSPTGYLFSALVYRSVYSVIDALSPPDDKRGGRELTRYRVPYPA
jgi:hypothetical protein